MLDAVSVPAGLIHSDLGGENVFVLGESYRVIDWQYPKRGPADLDLAILLESIGLDPRDYVDAGFVQPDVSLADCLADRVRHTLVHAGDAELRPANRPTRNAALISLLARRHIRDARPLRDLEPTIQRIPGDVDPGDAERVEPARGGDGAKPAAPPATALYAYVTASCSPLAARAELPGKTPSGSASETMCCPGSQRSSSVWLKPSSRCTSAGLLPLNLPPPMP